MDKELINNKLYETLERLGINNPASWHEYIDVLLGKLESLNDFQRYDGLLKNIFSSNDKKGFGSYAFEAAFAYDFEINGHQLRYEVNTLSNSLSSIDYCLENEGKKIFFELRVINQREVLTTEIENRLKNFGFYEILQGGEEEQREIIRLQNLILSKCQDENGCPIKFGHEDGSYNIIVVFVSALHLGMIDMPDCLLTMYGDEGVPFPFRRSVFGLYQQLSKHSTDENRRFYDKFKHFRETIHGVLFVRNVSRGGDPDYLVDLDLQYFFVANNAILEKEEKEDIVGKLSFLNLWLDK